MRIIYIDWFKVYKFNSLVYSFEDYCELVDGILWMNKNLFKVYNGKD